MSRGWTAGRESCLSMPDARLGGDGNKSALHICVSHMSGRAAKQRAVSRTERGREGGRRASHSHHPILFPLPSLLPPFDSSTYRVFRRQLPLQYCAVSAALSRDIISFFLRLAKCRHLRLSSVGASTKGVSDVSPLASPIPIHSTLRVRWSPQNHRDDIPSGFLLLAISGRDEQKCRGEGG